MSSRRDGDDDMRTLLRRPSHGTSDTAVTPSGYPSVCKTKRADRRIEVLQSETTPVQAPAKRNIDGREKQLQGYREHAREDEHIGPHLFALQSPDANGTVEGPWH